MALMPLETDTSKTSLGPLLLKRASRISVAVYKISDFFEVEEPLKIAVRNKSVELMKAALSYTTSPIREPGDSLKDISDSINALYALFDVLIVVGIVSLGNGEIIKEELMSLMNLVEKYYNESFGYMLSLRDFLDHVDLTLPTHTLTNNLAKRDVEIAVSKATKIPDISGFKTDRRAKILDYISKNGSSSIRDLAVIIKGCSEKTIQRELIGLIESGLIKREGERRWSKYSIIAK